MRERERERERERDFYYMIGPDFNITHSVSE